MRLAEGVINIRVRELREGDVYEIDTPNLAFNVTQAGAFRIDVNENGDATRITAIRGEGEVSANAQTYTIHAGERGEFNGVDNVTTFVAAAPAPDDFDRWSNDRDLRDDNSVSARYVSRDVPGYSDLDENGSWNEEPDYGPVWYPSQVNAGWAPYSYGSWNYVGPWGWTWVGYEPWGFAPYHYGRWAFIGSRWGWCPGPYYARPIYGPAFVGFLGGGFGFGFGFGGGIGWFPLGFHEPFRPWYHTSGAYFRNVNFANTRFRNSNFLNNRGGNFNYAYAHNVRAVTIASRNNFVNGQAINRGAFRMNEAALRGAQVSNRAGLSPTRQSYFGAAGTRGNIARPLPRFRIARSWRGRHRQPVLHTCRCAPSAVEIAKLAVVDLAMRRPWGALRRPMLRQIATVRPLHKADRALLQVRPGRCQMIGRSRICATRLPTLAIAARPTTEIRATGLRKATRPIAAVPPPDLARIRETRTVLTVRHGLVQAAAIPATR